MLSRFFRRDRISATKVTLFIVTVVVLCIVSITVAAKEKTDSGPIIQPGDADGINGIKVPILKDLPAPNPLRVEGEETPVTKLMFVFWFRLPGLVLLTW